MSLTIQIAPGVRTVHVRCTFGQNLPEWLSLKAEPALPWKKMPRGIMMYARHGNDRFQPTEVLKGLLSQGFKMKHIEVRVREPDPVEGESSVGGHVLNFYLDKDAPDAAELRKQAEALFQHVTAQAWKPTVFDNPVVDGEGKETKQRFICISLSSRQEVGKRELPPILVAPGKENKAIVAAA